jgi:phosphoribosylformylglycinamidine cyclo-ligase
MSTKTQRFPTTYQHAGVDTDRGSIGLSRIVSRIQQTWPAGEGIGSVKLPIGYFANVINMGDGIGMAISADGIGTKAIIAQMMGKYDTVGIDCVAMNVNDLICVGATPLSLVDYIAVQDPNPDLLDDLSKGLCAGAEMAKISISGGEIAQLQDIIKGYKQGFGFDLVGTAVGRVALDKILVGQNIEAGDIIIGIESNGIHSNGLTLARHVFFERNTYTIDTSFPALDRSLGAELLRPTHIYVQEALDILSRNIPVKAFIHITSDGFLNLTRVVQEVGYIIDALPPIPPVFRLIQEHGRVSDEEMFRVYNMGIGLCIVVAPQEADRVLSIIQSHHKTAHKIGYAVSDKERRVRIKQYGLVGQGKQFFKAGAE